MVTVTIGWLKEDPVCIRDVFVHISTIGERSTPTGKKTNLQLEKWRKPRVHVFPYSVRCVDVLSFIITVTYRRTSFVYKGGSFGVALTHRNFFKNFIINNNSCKNDIHYLQLPNKWLYYEACLLKKINKYTKYAYKYAYKRCILFANNLVLHYTPTIQYFDNKIFCKMEVQLRNLIDIPLWWT